MDTNTSTAKQQLLVWWVLWAAFQVGIVFIYVVFTRSTAPAGHPAELPWFIGAGPALVSVLIRWFALPKYRTPEQVLPWFIIGMAFAEASVILGIFIFRSHQQDLFVLGALGIFQFIPVYARRFFETAEKDRLRVEDSSL